MNYQKLFDYLQDEHGLTVNESDMQEIRNIFLESGHWISVNDRLPELKMLKNTTKNLTRYYAYIVMDITRIVSFFKVMKLKVIHIGITYRMESTPKQ